MLILVYFKFEQNINNFVYASTYTTQFYGISYNYLLALYEYITMICSKYFMYLLVITTKCFRNFFTIVGK